MIVPIRVMFSIVLCNEQRGSWIYFSRSIFGLHFGILVSMSPLIVAMIVSSVIVVNVRVRCAVMVNLYGPMDLSIVFDGTTVVLSVLIENVVVVCCMVSYCGVLVMYCCVPDYTGTTVRTVYAPVTIIYDSIIT